MKRYLIPAIAIAHILALGIVLGLTPPDDKPEKCQKGECQAPITHASFDMPKPGPPFDLIAKDLGVTEEQFREAFKLTTPPTPGTRPTREQHQNNRKILSEALGVAPDKVDAVMYKHRPKHHHNRPPHPMPSAEFPSPAAGQANAQDQDHGRPVALVAKDLGVTPEQFREAFKLVTPAKRGTEPTDAQRENNRKVLSEALGVSPEKLDAVMDKYRPEGPNKRPPAPTPPAE